MSLEELRAAMEKATPGPYVATLELWRTPDNEYKTKGQPSFLAVPYLSMALVSPKLVLALIKVAEEARHLRMCWKREGSWQCETHGNALFDALKELE